jgi:hypothetical protein
LGGLDYGISLWHLRVLCNNPFDGGGGYTPEQVGDMTPDQVYFRLCNVDFLRDRKTGRIKKVDTLALANFADSNGYIKGRAADGTPLLLPYALPQRKS